MNEQTILTLDELNERYGDFNYIEENFISFLEHDFGTTVANDTINMLQGYKERLVSLGQLRYGTDVLFEGKQSFKEQLDDNDFRELDLMLDTIHQFVDDMYDTDDCLFTYQNDIFDEPIKISEFIDYVKELN